MRKSLLLFMGFTLIMSLLSCAKEEFTANKGRQSSAVSAAPTTSLTSCAQHTLISPKVDVLLLWDNSSSALFINSSTKSSFNQLITSVSENFDYHILSAPLISTNSSNSLYEASLVAKNASSVSGNATGILRTKDQAASSLNFTSVSTSSEPGIDRVTSIIEANRSNGIFRNDAYTIIVVMSNGDDTSCENETMYNQCTTSQAISLLQPKINKLLCLRGNSSGSSCSGITTMNSSMMRFINISALTSCNSAFGKINTRYREVAKKIYEAPYNNGWPLPNDNLNPFTSGGIQYPDSYNICSISFSNIFDGVNNAIKQTLIKHVYDYWPVAGLTDSVDPDTIRVTRIGINNVATDLINNSYSSGTPTSGFRYIGDQINHSTRLLPTVGEPFTGKMIQLFSPPSTYGTHDQVIYPECLKVTYTATQSKYGYIYLQNGEPHVSTIEVRVNGNLVPQNATNGWNYMGLQLIGAIDTNNYKIVNYPYSSPPQSGYFLRLNGTAQFSNSGSNTVSVYYTSVSP